MVRKSQNLIRRERDGVAWYEAGGPAPGSDVLAAFSTRQGGVSDGGLASLNLSHRVSDDPGRVAENRRRLFQALGLVGRPVVAAGQVHGRRVAVVDDPMDVPVVPGVDGLVTAGPDVVLTLLFADCVPILAYDARRHAIGAAHAGWRGTLAGVAGELVRTLQSACHSRPDDLNVVVGPSIGACCYVVGPELIEAFRREWPDAAAYARRRAGAWRLDLWEANRRQIVAAGVPADRVAVAGTCTSCRCDEFYSHRAQGGVAGRFAAVIARRSGG